MDYKESKVGYIGEFEGRKGKGEMGNYNLKIKRNNKNSKK